MKSLVFASRNSKEILRDPINLFFGAGFPLVLLLLFTAIQRKVPVDIFAIGKMAPGVAVFGLSFIALFSGTLISKDRTTSFLMRLFASPLSSSDFILGYALPFLPMAIIQGILCFIMAFFLGLPVNANVLLSLAVMIPAAVFYIGIGLLVGSVFTDKQVGGICGALLTNLGAWLSGAWFDLNLVGGAFKTVAYLLPFAHAVDAAKAAVAGDYAGIFPHLWVVIGYAIASMGFAIVVFRKKMNSENM